MTDYPDFFFKTSNYVTISKCSETEFASNFLPTLFSVLSAKKLANQQKTVQQGC